MRKLSSCPKVHLHPAKTAPTTDPNRQIILAGLGKFSLMSTTRDTPVREYLYDAFIELFKHEICFTSSINYASVCMTHWSLHVVGQPDPCQYISTRSAEKALARWPWRSKPMGHVGQPHIAYLLALLATRDIYEILYVNFNVHFCYIRCSIAPKVLPKIPYVLSIIKCQESTVLRVK